jgi:hypothetical protein
MGFWSEWVRGSGEEEADQEGHPALLARGGEARESVEEDQLRVARGVLESDGADQVDTPAFDLERGDQHLGRVATVLREGPVSEGQGG